jgi:hypothetical protein
MKIALLICGQFRDESNIKSLNKFITNNMDVFVSTWQYYGKRHTESNLDTLELRFMNKDISKDIYKDLNEIKNIKDINSEELKSYKEFNFIHESIIKKCGNQNSPLGTVYNIYHITKCLELMKKYKTINNINYDIIIKIRPDLIVDQSINDTLFNNLVSSKYLYFSSNTSNKTGKSDKLFMGEPNIFSNFVEKINIYSCDIWKKDFTNEIDIQKLPIGERLFHHIVNYYNINYKIINDKGTYINR